MDSTEGIPFGWNENLTLLNVREGLLFSKLVRFFLLALICIAAFVIPIQASSNLEYTYRITEHNRSTGFSATMVKSLVRVPNGSLFVGTDVQLMHYHGNYWLSLPLEDQTRWIKDMLLTEDNWVLALSDGQLGEVLTTAPVEIKTLLDASNDPDFRFAKKIYQASDGSIWVACDTHVFRWKSGEIKKFAVPYRELAQRNFLHAYHFLESDQGDLFLISFVGEAFHINRNTGSIDKIQNWRELPRTTCVFPVENNRFLVGCEEGLFEVEISDTSSLEIVGALDVEIGPVLAICKFDDGDFIVSEEGGKVFRLGYRDTPATLQLISKFKESVFRIVSDRFNEIWLLTDSQFFSLATMPFERLKAGVSIRSMALGANGTHFVGIENELFLMDRGFNSKPISSFDEAILSVLRWNDETLVSLGNGEVWSVRSDFEKQLVCRLAFPATDLAVDGKEWIWAIEAGRSEVAYFQMHPDCIPNYVNLDENRDIFATQVETARDGSLWVSGNQMDGFLYRWNPELNSFENESHLVESEHLSVSANDFGTNGLSEGKGNHMLVATTQGIIEADGSTCKWLHLEDFPLYEFHSVVYDEKNDVYWGNIYNHLLMMDLKKGRVDKYDSLLGLPSMLDRNQSLLQGDDYLYFVGNEGLYVRKSNEQGPTCITPTVFIMGSPFHDLDSGSLKVGNEEPFIFSLGTPEFPEDLMMLHAVLTSPDGTKRNLDYAGSFHPFVFENLHKSGKYTLEVWSSSPGFRPESEHLYYHFSVYSVFLRKVIVTTFIVILAVGLIAILFFYRLEQQKKQIRKLDKEVAKRVRDLVQKNKQLEDSNRVRDRLFSVIGHDLRGSVGNIKTLLELLPDPISEQDLPAVAEYLPYINSESESTYNLLNNLLNWSKAQLGGIAVTMESVLLSEIVTEVMDVFLNRIRQKNLKLFLEFDSNTSLMGDVDCLKTVMRNLIGNAIKFCRNGDQIRIRAVPLEASPETLEICVSDNGPGMREETLQKLRDQHQFFTTKGTEGESGSGIGINLCVEMLNLMGSRLEIESEPGKGSSFCFSLPVD